MRIFSFCGRKFLRNLQIVEIALTKCLYRSQQIFVPGSLAPAGNASEKLFIVEAEGHRKFFY